MKKKRIITLSIIIIIVLLFSTLFMGFIRKSKGEIKEYNSVIKDAFYNNQDVSINEIAMLGAHDAFSSGINIKSSPDYNEGGIVTNKLVNTLAKGLVVRLSKAQIASAKEMLYSGVRYFDVRISRVDGEYYCCHGYLSNKLEYYVNDIVDFLNDNPGEIVIFDIQYFYADTEKTREDYIELFDYLSTLGLTDFSNGITNDCDISSIKYKDITLNGTKSGVLFLAKVVGADYCFKRDLDADKDEDREYYSIRSYWHEKNSDKDMIIGIKEEIEFINNSDKYDDILRVNQAQKTGFIVNASIVRSMCKWSLINMADDFNYKLIEDENLFNEMLDAMPILMVDYATSSKKDFNNRVNKLILEYNKGL